MLDTIPFTSVCSNLEHGLAILTESFSPLRSVLHNLSCWSPKQKCMQSYAIPFYTCTLKLDWTDLNWFWASHSHYDWRDYKRAKCLVENSIVDADVILSRYFDRQGS